MTALRAIEVRGFRNLEAQTIELGARFNVLAGENGQGKTNVLEAIYLVATSRSFRTSAIAECVAHGAESTLVRAAVLDERLGPEAPPRIQAVSVVAGRRSVTLDGKRPRTLASYATATPIVLFEPASLALSQGGAAERRRLLDRVAVHLAARDGGADALLHDAERYRRAHVQRRKALAASADPRAVASYERLMAEHGARIVRARTLAAAALAPVAQDAFARVARVSFALDVRYVPRAPDDADAFAAKLAERRMDDARRGTATIGPHLDDLALAFAGRPARQVASQGQHRAVVLALKGAELEVIRAAREVEPILLLDDVSSELDPSRNAALFELILERRGQVVLTTTRPELIEIASARRDFLVHAGAVARSGAGP